MHEIDTDTDFDKETSYRWFELNINNLCLCVKRYFIAFIGKMTNKEAGNKLRKMNMAE